MNSDEPEPKTILLVLWDGGGVVPPLLGVARRLVERSHTVVVLGDPTIEPEAAANGCVFTSLAEAPHRTSRDRSDDLVRDYLGKPRQQMREFREYFFNSGAAWTSDVARAIDAHGVDLVMADFMLIWAGVAAETRGVPFVSLLTFPYAIPSAGFPPLGASLVPVPKPLQRFRDRLFGAMSEKLYDGSKKTLNQLREQHGLPAVRHSLDQVRSADAIVVLTSRSFDFPGCPAPENVTWSGPILDDPAWAAAYSPPWAHDDERPPSARGRRGAGSGQRLRRNLSPSRRIDPSGFVAHHPLWARNGHQGPRGRCPHGVHSDGTRPGRQRSTHRRVRGWGQAQANRQGLEDKGCCGARHG